MDSIKSFFQLNGAGDDYAPHSTASKHLRNLSLCLLIALGVHALLMSLYIVGSNTTLGINLNWNFFKSAWLTPLLIIGFILSLWIRTGKYRTMTKRGDDDWKPSQDITDTISDSILMPLLARFVIIPIVVGAMIYYAALILTSLLKAVFPFLLAAGLIYTVYYFYKTSPRLMERKQRAYLLPMLAAAGMLIHFLCCSAWLNSYSPLFVYAYYTIVAGLLVVMVLALVWLQKLEIIRRYNVPIVLGASLAASLVVIASLYFLLDTPSTSSTSSNTSNTSIASSSDGDYIRQELGNSNYKLKPEQMTGRKAHGFQGNVHKVNYSDGRLFEFNKDGNVVKRKERKDESTYEYVYTNKSKYTFSGSNYTIIYSENMRREKFDSETENLSVDYKFDQLERVVMMSEVGYGWSDGMSYFYKDNDPLPYKSATSNSWEEGSRETTSLFTYTKVDANGNWLTCDVVETEKLVEYDGFSDEVSKPVITTKKYSMSRTITYFP